MLVWMIFVSNYFGLLDKFNIGSKPINSQKLGDFIVSRCQALKIELPYADGKNESPRK